MPHSFGYRAHTRDLFQKKFRKHGLLPTQTYLKIFRVGQIVDLAGDGGVHKGMPHKFYHGKTGIVWNVTPRAIGVVVNKRVNTRIVQKRLHVRIEHAKHSKCRQEFLDRVKRNEAIKKEVKTKKAPKVNTKRIVPDQPKAGRFVEGGKRVITLQPLAYVGLYQG